MGEDLLEFICLEDNQYGAAAGIQGVGIWQSRRPFDEFNTGIVPLALGLPHRSRVVAHHGFDTEYDAKKKVKLEGVVTQVAWTNPHMRVYIDVTGPDGKVVNWNLELTEP